MSAKRWYIDTSVLVSYFSTRQEERGNKKIAKKIFTDAADAVNLELVTSHWTLTELTRTLVKTHRMDRERVTSIVTGLIRHGRVEGAKVHLVDLSPRADYTFAEMCSDLQDGIMVYTIGFQDVLHTIIMKNNGIDTILTFDDGFEAVDGLYVVDVDNQ